MNFFKAIIGIAFLLFNYMANAQFAPQVGNAASTAIYKDSSIIKAWASGCTVTRGFQNCADTSLGLTSVGDELSAVGKAGLNGVVSLGDGGQATLVFDHPVFNGNGADFAVFENGFLTDSLAYLELAFVEVSSDGINYIRFPSISNVDTLHQLNYFSGIDASKLNNLAGKYIGLYGTPFDLDELKGINGLDINNITHIKVIDVVGSIESKYATQDARNHVINDPWPTPFPSSGFDLDAVAVINEHKQVSVKEIKEIDTFRFFPNPIVSGAQLNLHTLEPIVKVSIINALGKSEDLIVNKDDTQDYLLNINIECGVYFLKLETLHHIVTRKLCIQ